MSRCSYEYVCLYVCTWKYVCRNDCVRLAMYVHLIKRERERDERKETRGEKKRDKKRGVANQLRCPEILFFSSLLCFYLYVGGMAVQRRTRVKKKQDSRGGACTVTKNKQIDR